MAILQRALPVAMLLFVLSSMLAMGFGLTVAQIIAPLRNGRLVAFSLLANFVLMPLAALALAKTAAAGRGVRRGAPAGRAPPARRSCRR